MHGDRDGNVRFTRRTRLLHQPLQRLLRLLGKACLRIPLRQRFQHFPRLAIPFGIATFLCFLPLPFSPTGKLVWASLSYLVLGVIYSAINVPYGVLSNMIAVDPQERVSLNAFRMGGCQLGQLAVAGLTLPAIATKGFS